MVWAEERDENYPCMRWRRSDGAMVRWAGGPRFMEYIAFEPDPSDKYLIRYSKRGLGWPRRWKTPEAAMRAVDKEFPHPTPTTSA